MSTRHFIAVVPCAAALALTAIAALPAQAQIVSGVMTVTGAEMH